MSCGVPVHERINKKATQSQPSPTPSLLCMLIAPSLSIDDLLLYLLSGLAANAALTLLPIIVSINIVLAPACTDNGIVRVRLVVVGEWIVGGAKGILLAVWRQGRRYQNGEWKGGMRALWYGFVWCAVTL